MTAPRPRMSLLVTLGLAALGAACKSNGGAADASPGGRDAPGGADGAGGTGGGGGSGGRDAAGGPDRGGMGGTGGRDASLARDLGIDMGVDATVDAGAGNAGRLWFHGPESDLHLSDVEPETPF